MTDFYPYENLGQQYFSVNAILYATQPEVPLPLSDAPWQSRYGSPCKMELKATSHMTLEQVVLSNLPDAQISNCRAFITQMPFRTHGTIPYGKNKREVPLSELAIRLRDSQLIVQLVRPLEGDTRHKLLVELLKKESKCLECLQSINGLLECIDLMDYDFRVFTPLHHLIDLISSFGSEMKKVLDEWDPLRVFIGRLFISFQTLWSRHYATFFKQYKNMSRFVEEKRLTFLQNHGNSERDRNEAIEIDSVFKNLETFLVMPFEQVDTCERTLYTILTEHTPLAHPDRERISKAYDLVKDTLKIATLEKQASDNERILKLIQDKFPSDTLFLYNRTSLDVLQSYKKFASSTGFPQKGKLKQQMSRQRDESQTSQFSDSSRNSTQTSEIFAPPPRTLLREGPFYLCNLQSPTNRHERHMMLLSDLLIISKPTHHHKSTSHLQASQSNVALSLKQLIPLQFVWTSEQLELDLGAFSGVGFLIGWPAENSGVNNVLAIYSSSEERRQWLNTINDAIYKVRQDLPPVRVSVQLGPEQFITREVAYEMRTNQLQEKSYSVITKQPGRGNVAPEYFALLLVVKDTHHYHLIGCECPAAIRAYHATLYSWRKGHPATVSESSDTGCYFQMKQVAQDVDPQEKGHRKRMMTKLQFAFKKQARFQTTQPTQSDTSRLFRMPLDTIMPSPDHSIPPVLSGILVKLYSDGPLLSGIFRVEGSARQVAEVIRRIEEGEEVDFEEYRVVVVANVLKRFLRAIPGCLLSSSKYTEFAATNDIKCANERVERIRKILAKMPPANCVLAHHVFAILREISDNEPHNKMSALNLGKCLGPSILQPMECLNVYQLEMHDVVAFVVEHCEEVFGKQIPELYRNMQTSKQKVLVPVTDETTRRHPLTSREDSNESMDSGVNRTAESGESDTPLTPTNERSAPRGAERYRRDSETSLRARFLSEPNMQRTDHPRSNESQLLKKNVSVEGTELASFDSPGSQSRSTPNSPDLVRSSGHLEVPQRESQSRSTPNTPEVVRATQNKRQMEAVESSDEEDQSNLRTHESADFTSPQYYQRRVANQNPPAYPHSSQPLPLSSHPYQTPSYHKHSSIYSNSRYQYAQPQPSNEYGMQRITQATGTYPHTLPSNRSFENNVRDKPRTNQLTRSSASYELSNSRTMPHLRNATSHHQDTVLPLSTFQRARAVIENFPVVQEFRISKLSELNYLPESSHV